MVARFMVRGFREGGDVRIYRRARDLYATQIGLLMAVSALLYVYAMVWEDTSVIDGFRLWPLVAHPAKTMLHALTLRYQPTYLDILPGYIAIFLALPFMLWLAHAEECVGGAGRVFRRLSRRADRGAGRFYTTPENATTWLVQSLFGVAIPVHGLGAAFGSGRLAAIKPWLRWWPVVTLAAIVAGGIALKVGTAAWHEFMPQVPSINYAGASPTRNPLSRPRASSTLPVAGASGVALHAAQRKPLRRFRFARGIIVCGQQSLSVFSAGVILSALASILAMGRLDFAMGSVLRDGRRRGRADRFRHAARLETEIGLRFRQTSTRRSNRHAVVSASCARVAAWSPLRLGESLHERRVGYFRGAAGAADVCHRLGRAGRRESGLRHPHHAAGDMAQGIGPAR